MKKIFVFFAALVYVVSISAKTIYLVPGQWSSDGAKFSVYSVQTQSFSSFLTTEDGVHYGTTVADDTQVIFVRHDATATAPSWENKWNQTEDLTVPAGQNCWEHTEWGKDGGPCKGTWSNFDPTVIPDYYITGTGNIVGGEGWKANEIKMTLNEEGVYSHTFTAVAANDTCRLKITDGTWVNSWGYDALQDVPDGVITDKDRNIVFVLAEAGDVVVTFKGGQVTVAGNFVAPEVSYVLMGVKGDWKTGVALTKNDENKEFEEYQLLGQEIAAGDSVKVARLENGEVKHWCGNVKEGCKELLVENTVNDNIVLAPGKYDFYYEVQADAIWIAVVTENPNGVDNVVVEGKAVKVMRNGQMCILRDGIHYNMLGQIAE